MIQEKIKNYFIEHREEMIRDIQSFIRVESTKSDAQEGMPFGEKTAKMLQVADERMSELGFKTTNYENYVLTARNDTLPLKLDILAHLDVVPADPEEWKVTAPFEPIVMDGAIYGRGSADDKGPTVAALYAMKAVKDLNVPLKYGTRLILGADEESGSEDIKYFYRYEKPASMTFTPDADFPIINCEKGGYWSAFNGNFGKISNEVSILRFSGGTVGNAIPGNAEAEISGLDLSFVNGICRKSQDETGVTFCAEKTDAGVRIRAIGKTAHASTPEMGDNAITALLDALRKLIPESNDGTEALLSLSELFPHGVTDGSAAGVALQDDNGCALTLALTILSFDGTQINGRIDCRTPVCATEENTVRVLKKLFGMRGILLESDELCPAHYVPENSELVQKLLECFEMYTGNKGVCLTSGGMTYAHQIENAVAFGCMFPDRNNRMHGADEHVAVDELVLSAEIFAQAIVKICG